MKNYKITIQYDGTRYCGWQRLKNKETIQGKIEDVLSVFFGHKIEIHASGRTDAGVHAEGQVANFKVRGEKNPEEIKEYLNRYLPSDISVMEISEVDERFHSRLSASEKVYCYRILNSGTRDVFSRRFVHQIPQRLDVEEMRRGGKYFEGIHDFKAFCQNKHFKKSSVREIYSVNIETAGNEIRITYRGNGFLYNMVRIMTGTLIDVGLGKKRAEDIPLILESKLRENAGETAPAKGLALKQVIY